MRLQVDLDNQGWALAIGLKGRGNLAFAIELHCMAKYMPK